MPSLKQVQKAPTKGRGLSGSDSEDIDSRHVFQTPKLRTVYNLSQGEHENLKILMFHQILIYLMILHVFQTPKLKKVETNDSDIEMSLEHNIEERSTNNTNYGIYFERSQLRNVPKPTETLRNIIKRSLSLKCLI